MGTIIVMKGQVLFTVIQCEFYFRKIFCCTVNKYIIKLKTQSVYFLVNNSKMSTKNYTPPIQKCPTPPHHIRIRD